MKNELTTREKKVFEELKALNIDSLWGLGISKAIESGDSKRFRELIEQLQSQAKDNPVIMRRILGSAYRSVMRLNNKNRRREHQMQNNI